MRNKYLFLASCLTFAMLASTAPSLNVNASGDRTIGIEESNVAEPEVKIWKTAQWYNPNGDNANVDFDNKQDIDIDGIVKVELKVNIKNVMINSNDDTVSASNILVADYFDDTKWVLVKKVNFGYDVSDGVLAQKDNKLVWSIPNYNSGYDLTLVYYLQLKESYWNVNTNTDYYINGVQETSMSYLVNNKQRNLTCDSPNVTMRPIKWIPQVSKLSIDESEYVYKNIKSNYNETYFVNANLLLESNLNINAQSQMNRAYDDYQISENLFDIYQNNKNQVVSSYIGLNENTSFTIKDDTSRSVSTDYAPGSILNFSGTNNEKPFVEAGSVSTGIEKYNGAKLLTKSSFVVKNNDDNVISIYPFARTVSSDGMTYETTRNLETLRNKRVDIIADGISPSISSDIKFQTKSDKGVEWTESDGYIDINLVDGNVNPNALAHTLTFRITDNESGISNPDFLTNDWINVSSDNIQILLTRVDNDEIVIFDSNTNKNNKSDVVSVQYNSAKGINDTAVVKIVLDPKNKDILGHLKLTIKAYDNVKNSVEKTYDIYSFCLTAEIETDNNIPRDGKTQGIVVLENGERGRIDITAAGYADSVDVDFENKLETLYAQDIGRRVTFNEPTKLAGSYPHDDIVNYADESSYSSTNNLGKYILPKNLQVNTWSVSEDTLGGVDVSIGFDKLNELAAQREAEKEAVRAQRAAEKEEAIREMVDQMISDILDNYEEDEVEESDEELEDMEEANETKSKEDLYDYDELYAKAKAIYEETEEPDEFDFVKNDILQENFVELLNNFANNTNTSITGDNFHLEGITLYTYPTFSGGRVNTYAHVYKLNYSNPKTIGNKAYPTSIILDGNTNIEVTYNEDGGVQAIIEDYTDVTTIDDQIQASWIATGSGMKRPFSHYFYMPLSAPETYYIVKVTEYKDSDTTVPHSVSIQLTFSNTAQGSRALSELHSVILDN